MPPFLLFSDLIGGTGGSMVLLSLTIIVSTSFLEDPTAVIVGMLAADGAIPIPIALLSLYAGTVLGDTGIYFLGRMARTHEKLARYVDHGLVVPFRAWLETRFVLTVFSARFIPGSRLPTYAASGFFRSPLPTFVLTAIIATVIWTTILFSASFWFGSITSGWLEHARWGIAGAFLIALFLIGRHNLLAYQTQKDAPLKSGAPSENI